MIEATYPMRKLKTPQAGTLSVDDIEAAFYDALKNGDIEKLMACWSDEDEMVCIHPSGSRQLGPVAIRGAFEAMFANGSVQAFPEKVRRLDAGPCSVHSVVERVAVMSDDGMQHAWVVATNVYAKTAQGWRMVAHHASPGTRTEPVEVLTAQPVLH